MEKASTDFSRKELALKALRHPKEALYFGWQCLVSRWKVRGCTTAGPWIRVVGRLMVHNKGSIILGEHICIRGSHVPVELASFPGGKLEIGAHTFINSGVSICAQEAVTIGKNCAIGNYTLIMDTDFHNVGELTQTSEAKPVRIEDNVWLAAHVIVLKGVRIGQGAVVAAGAVVTRDVPPYTLVGGVPAKFIRKIE